MDEHIPPPAAESASPDHLTPDPEAAPARILVVVDEKDVAHLVTSVLASEGYETVSVPSAAEAWGVLASGPVSLVILDLMLPDTDGRKLLLRLRERADTAAIPVVMLSARDDSAIKSQCFALGVDGFFGKPVDPDVLVSFVTALLQKTRFDQRDAGSDALTGLLNRAGLLEAVMALPPQSPLALVLVDVDDFEELTYRIGWSAAERVLAAAGRALSRARPADAHLARWEGSEFILALPGREEEEARQAGEALLASMRSGPFAETGEGPPLSCSAGLAWGAAEGFLEGLLETARYRLFRARAAGGDRLGWERSTDGGVEIRIVVAEDDQGTAAVLRGRLQREGFDLDVYEDGSEAYRAILERPPDLVLLDVRMPGMDGFELLTRLRRTPEHQRTPIIMLTGLGKEADLVRGFELGADDYVVKPFSPTELLARMHRLLGRRRAPH